MGCVVVREDARDWYLRSRTDLLKSILDGLDYDESVANFAFAKLNLHRHNLSIEKSVEDLLCDTIVRKEMNNQPYMALKIQSLLEEAKTADTNRKMEILDEISALEESMKSMEHVAVDTKRKRERETEEDVDFRRGAEHRLAPHVWSGRFTERDLIDLASNWADAPMDNDMHYPDAHMFHQRHHPLRKKHAVTGRTKMTELLRSFSLPSKPGGKSVAAQYKEHEKDMERIHQKSKNPAVVGHSKYDTQLGRDIDHFPFMGSLQDHYLHDIYLKHYHDWKDANPDIEKEVNEKFTKAEDREFALMQRHFEDAADSWESNDYHHTNINPKENMTEQDIQDFVYSGGNMDDLDEIPISQGLGHKGYMMGLEFFDPLQRHKILEHLHEKGSDAHDAQKIDLGNNNYVSAGRIKANIAQRFTPEFLHAIRTQTLHGPNGKAHVERIDDHPLGEDVFLRHALLDALMATPHAAGTVGQHLINEYNDILFDPDFLEFDEEGGLLERLNHLPLKGLSQISNIKRRIQDDDNPRQALTDELLELDKNPPTHMDKKQLLALCGYHEDGTPMDEDDHPLLPEFDGSFIEPEKIDEILEKAKELGALSSKQKDIRNYDAWQYLGLNGPDIHSIPENEKEAWATGQDGNPIGLGSHFASPWHHQGGHGKSVIGYLEQLHDSLPKDKDGFSLVGKVHDGELIPNPKTVGLFGRYLPSLYDRRYGTHSGAHGLISFWDACSHLSSRGKIRNPKNTPFRFMTSLSGGYSNKIRYLTTQERKDLFSGRSLRGPLYDKGQFTTNPVLSIGGKKDGLIQTRNKAKMANRLLTNLGRLYPPHAPAPFRILKRKDVNTGRYPLSHNENNSNLYASIQGHAGISGISDRGKYSRGRRKGQKGKDLKYLKDKASTEGFALSQEQEEEFDHLSDEYETLSQKIGSVEQGTEEYAILNQRLHELENTIEGLYEDARSVRGSKRGYTAHFDNLEAKDEADLAAMIEMAKKIKPLLEKEDPEAFDPSNPAKFLANSARLMKDANRALLILPHTQHGLSTHGYDEEEIERKSVSQLLSDHIGEKTIPHHKLAITLGMAGKEIRPDMSDAKILQQLG
mgnify:CR=1 FL=1